LLVHIIVSVARLEHDVLGCFGAIFC